VCEDAPVQPGLLTEFLPPALGLTDNIRLLTDLAATVAPALGWSPGS
jgi:hypothetical protein